MQRRATTAAVPVSAAGHVLRAVSFTVLVLLILTWSHAANGSEPLSQQGFAADPATAPAQANLENRGATGAESGAESVTMTIPLEDDGVIDVEAPHMDVKIEKWDGDDVLLIVEKKKTRASASRDAPAEAVTIQVTREGKNVHIETAGDSKKRAGLSDVSFRIVLPEDDETAVTLNDRNDAVDRLTAVVWRVLGREALRWLTH